MRNGDNMFGEAVSLGTVYTIERHLKMYAKSEDTTERHQVLWHAWNQNKRWLTQLLEWTLPSFPTYSYHNASHADTVLHNIERILGENRIRQLSASDCFMLLHTAYMHDIGMSISAAERKGMMKDEKFVELIEYLKREGDSDMKKAAESVLQTQYTTYQEFSTRERGKKLKELFQQKLDVYYGLSQNMAEYQRRQHAEFVAVMLQLGDALDMDNDRFNPFVFQFTGNFPRTSTLHFKKHQAMRQLQKTKIYLKGIYVQSHSMYQDSELLELIDIKGGKIGKSHIAINRDEFTKEGLDYLENEIYPSIISSAKAALVELNEQVVLEGEKWQSADYKSFDKKIMDSIEEKTRRCMNNQTEDFLALKLDLKETVLSAVGLSYFLWVLGKEKIFFCEKTGGR